MSEVCRDVAVGLSLYYYIAALHDMNDYFRIWPWGSPLNMVLRGASVWPLKAAWIWTLKAALIWPRGPPLDMPLKAALTMIREINRSVGGIERGSNVGGIGRGRNRTGASFSPAARAACRAAKCQKLGPTRVLRVRNSGKTTNTDPLSLREQRGFFFVYEYVSD